MFKYLYALAATSILAVSTISFINTNNNEDNLIEYIDMSQYEIVIHVIPPNKN